MTGTQTVEKPVTTSEAILELERVSYSYGPGVVALADVSLQIRSGEWTAILGANGSGKSTLIKVLDGLIFPQSGQFRAYGEPVSEQTLRHEPTAYRFRRRVGFIFQNADAQLFSQTVREEIAFGPLQLSMPGPEVEQRIADVAALLEIEKLLDRPPFQLSGGEKRKVAIAAALAVNPDVLLLDEPSTGLDPRSQYWLVTLLRKLHAAGKTLVTATHDLTIVPDIADRALVFGEDHKLAADGPVSEILNNPDLLIGVNLVHEHWHRHGTMAHSHPHPPRHSHDGSSAV